MDFMLGYVGFLVDVSDQFLPSRLKFTFGEEFLKSYFVGMCTAQEPQGHHTVVSNQRFFIDVAVVRSTVQYISLLEDNALEPTTHHCILALPAYLCLSSNSKENETRNKDLKSEILVTACRESFVIQVRTWYILFAETSDVALGLRS